MIAANVPRETEQRLELLKHLIFDETKRQNLIAPSTIPNFDTRHVQDSLQLRDHLSSGDLIDVGSGAGFPGLVLACFGDRIVHLIEPRAKRAAFLQSAVEMLELATSVYVYQARAEIVRIRPVATITARAVAGLEELFGMAIHMADENTRWVLPKGRNAALELAEAQRTWQGSFRLVPSVTDASAAIVIAEGVRRRQAR